VTGRPLALALATLGTVAVASLLAGCDDNGSRLPFDPDHARDIARDVLLDPDDLPGTGWAMSSEEYSEVPGGGAADPFDFPGEGACGLVNRRLGDYQTSSTGKRAIEAKRDLARPGTGGTTLQTEVSSEMEVYRDGADLGSDLPFLRAVVQSDDFDACMRETFSRSAAEIAAGDLAVVVAKRAEPGAIPPQGGAAFAFDLEIKAAGTAIEMRVEQYFWATANAVLSVQATGARQDVSHDVVQTAIDSLARKAEKEKVPPG
jgi:hypothetical protein